MQRIAEHHAFHQRDADGDWKRNGESDDLNARDQQHVCDIEDESAQRCVEKVDVVGCVEVCQEGIGIAGAAAHRKSEHEGYEEDAQTVVPVIKFEAIILRPFEGICEGAPADGAEDSHQKCNVKRGWNKHAAKAPARDCLDRLSFVREASHYALRDGNLEIAGHHTSYRRLRINAVFKRLGREVEGERQ